MKWRWFCFPNAKKWGENTGRDYFSCITDRVLSLVKKSYILWGVTCCCCAPFTLLRIIRHCWCCIFVNWFFIFICCIVGFMHFSWHQNHFTLISQIFRFFVFIIFGPFLSVYLDSTNFGIFENFDLHISVIFRPDFFFKYIVKSKIFHYLITSAVGVGTSFKINF